MIKNSIQLAKDLHRKMGYPLGKVHYRMQLVANGFKGYGSPIRHVRRVAYKVRNLEDVMARRKAARGVTQDLPPGIATRVRELREKGFAYFTEQVDPQLLAELGKFYDEVLTRRSAVATPSPTHPFFFSLIEPEDYATDHIMMRFAMQKSILQAVSAYFGSVPLLNPVGIQESRPVKIVSKKMRASQQWHLDYTAGGDEAVSVWVYFTDVNSVDQGPLTYLPIAATRKVKNTFFPGRIEDEQIEEFGLTKDVEPILGSRLTVFLISTHKCYHMGSRVKEGNKRVVGIFPFYKAADVDDFVKITSPVDETQKMLICR
ncbi:MAG: hypothetical protein WDN28_28995 [Chthoniobacter sp.]